MDTIRNDVVYALRSLAHSPGLTLAAVLCLALGIGATTTIYSATRALVLNPVPVRDADRVVRITEMPPNAPEGTDGVSPGTLLEWQRELRALDQVAGFAWADVSLTGMGEPERVGANRVTPNFFAILHSRPLHGRVLVAADARSGPHRVVVLSYGLWQRRFGGAHDAVGKPMLIDGEAHQIVGVMPRNFVFPAGVELWLPLAFSPAAQEERGSNQVSAIGRLVPGFTIAQANTEARALEQRVAERYPEHRAQWDALVEPIQRFYGRNPRPYMMVAMVAVTLVLLIGCANVANLLLARAAGRGRELAIRTALGASRLCVIRLLLTESIVLALLGGVAGVLLALWGVLLFRHSIPAELMNYVPGWDSVRVNGPTLSFALLVALGSSLLFGVFPALQAARGSIQGSLRDGGRGTAGTRVSNRTRNGLVIAEVALAVTLVVSTGLALRSFRELLEAHPGFRSDHVLTMQIALPSRYDSLEKRVAFYQELTRQIRQLPEVRAVGLVSVLPMDWGDAATRATNDARPNLPEAEQPIVRTRAVSAGYFATLAIPLIRGRAFDSRDQLSSPPVVILSEQLARRFWPNADPLGKRVRMLGDTSWREVVGIVADIRHNPNAGEAIQPTLHFPTAQFPARRTAIVIRTSAEPMRVALSTQQTIATLDPALAAGEVRTLDRVLYNALAPQRLTARMLGLFGFIALALACVGVYGVMSYSVTRRASEIGVRMALGAHRNHVLGLVLKQGGTLTGVGLVIGLAGALMTVRAMGAVMFDTAALDPLTLAAALLILSATALLACYLPARRAAAADPTLLLRQE